MGHWMKSLCWEMRDLWGSRREPEVQHFGRQTMGSSVSAGGWAEGGRRGSAGCRLQGLELVNPCWQSVEQCQKWVGTGDGDGPLQGSREGWGGLGRAGPGWDRVKGGAGTAAVTGEEEKCQMNLFPVYNENTPKQIFILIKNIHIKGS